MTEITVVILSAAWTVAIAATVVWDRGPVEAVVLAVLRARRRPAALACYVCAAWWIAPPVALVAWIATGEAVACAAGAGLAIAAMWWSLPAHARMAPPRASTPRSSCRNCGQNKTHQSTQELGL